MRRLITGAIAFTAFTGVVLVLPVYAAPTPEAEPVPTSAQELSLGSVESPAPQAEVQEGTTDPVAGVAEDEPTLALTATDVESFSLVGVTWAEDPAVTDIRVQLRVRDADGDWGTWTEVGVEDADQDTGDDVGQELRGGTPPVWTGPGAGVEVEVVTRSGAEPTDVRLDLIDPGTSAADASLSAPDVQDTAGAAMGMPAIYSRAQWGADESIRTWAPEYAPTIRAATLHHTADANNYAADQVPALMRSIYRYHTVSRGWGDIGYNVIVDKYGRLWEGRYGGLSSTVVGAHAGGFNTGTFGVSMLGNYDTVTAPQAMVDAVAAVVAWKFSLYDVDPRGTVTLTSGGGGTAKYAAGVRVTLPTVFGHRDVGSTSCPGQYGYGRLGEIRTKVATLIAAARTPIEQRYDEDAALRASLGAPVGTEQVTSGVSWQAYQRGRLYHSPSTGTHLMRNAILDTYLAAGGPAALGGPTSDEAPTADGRGAHNRFRNSAIYWSAATGTHVVRNAILERWAATGYESGPLGFPVEDELAAPGGAYTPFERGAIYWSPETGAQVVTGALREEWSARGGVSGSLGYPTAAEQKVADATWRQSFRFGDLLWSASGEVRAVVNAIRDAWVVSGAASGRLGLPVDDESPTAGGDGVVQRFSSGAVFWTAGTGAIAVVGEIQDYHEGTGAERGVLGYPVASEVVPTGSQARTQDFAGGHVVFTPVTGAHAVRNAMADLWRAQGAEAGYLGYPTTDERALADGRGVVQSFQRGSVYWNAATGAHAMTGAIADHYAALGAEKSVLGYPADEVFRAADGRGYGQRFERGWVFWSPTTGAHAVRNAMADLWRAQGAEAGYLGYPTTDERALADGRGVVQSFQRGSVYWNAATGAHAMTGAIADHYAALGAEKSVLGYPADEVFRAADGRGYGQRFERGWVFWSPTTGAHAVVNAIAAEWTRKGSERGILGYPLAAEAAVPGAPAAVVQRFAGGEVYWTAAHGAMEVSGAIRDAYRTQGGPSGWLGLPTSGMSLESDGVTIQQTFTGGVLRWSPQRGVFR
ncbi:N-acetylmuramoyl-L-alanine amidase [Geodermatophilus sp. SYSU D01180]